MSNSKLLNYRDVSYEVYGKWMTTKMLYPLSVSENFADLANARHCAKMLKRGGCEVVKIHRIKITREKKDYKRIPFKGV